MEHGIRVLIFAGFGVHPELLQEEHVDGGGSREIGGPFVGFRHCEKIVILKRNVTKNKIRLCFCRLSYKMGCIHKFRIYQMICQAPYHLIAVTSSALPRKALHL